MNNPSRTRKAKPKLQKGKAKKKQFPIVAIGSSAGGLEALKKFFSAMPPAAGLAFVVISHLDPSHKSILAELLSKYTEMKVVQVGNEMKVNPDTVYVIPPNKDMKIDNLKLYLTEPKVREGVRHPIDFFFRSLAEDVKENAACIIFSGTGTEGAIGLKEIKGYGGIVMAQDIKTAAYSGMPSAAIDTGQVDYILPPEKMPEELISYMQQTQSVLKRVSEPGKGSAEEYADFLKKILMIIKSATGRDFSNYKKNTIIRRIERRMNLQKVASMDDYIKYLYLNPAEQKALFKELLIGVTSFFRDPEVFDIFQKEYLPSIVKDKAVNEPIRIWVPA
ncbi:MAG: chemotaxis protein CheB, partial [Candidatus Omnitrophota bacterium]